MGRTASCFLPRPYNSLFDNGKLLPLAPTPVPSRNSVGTASISSHRRFLRGSSLTARGRSKHFPRAQLSLPRSSRHWGGILNSLLNLSFPLPMYTCWQCKVCTPSVLPWVYNNLFGKVRRSCRRSQFPTQWGIGSERSAFSTGPPRPTSFVGGRLLY